MVERHDQKLGVAPGRRSFDRGAQQVEQLLPLRVLYQVSHVHVEQLFDRRHALRVRSENLQNVLQRLVLWKIVEVEAIEHFSSP
jgi:hypothetical protein